MTPRVRRALLLTLVAALTATAGFTVAIAPQPTRAAWQDPKTLAATATATAVTPPTALTCGASSGGLFSSIPFTWTAPAGTTPSGYTLKWTGAATGQASFSTTSGSVPPAALLGNITVSVYADYGSWQSAAGTQTRLASVLIAGVLWGCS